MNPKNFLFLLFTFFCVFLAHGQGYTSVEVDLQVNHGYNGGEYGGGVSFVDFDQDGWDDLTFTQTIIPIQFYKNNQGTYQEITLLEESYGEAKQVTWVDYDNDGDRDLFITHRLAPFKLFQNDGDLNLSDVSAEVGLDSTFYESYGHSWGDVNNDGWLDLYIANYNDDGVTNLLYVSDGDGTFTEMAVELGVDNDSWYSFGGVFMDYNNDGWQDLFVINDRLDASNSMYQNTGVGGVFEETTEACNLGYNIFSMSNSCADYDNDGDLDIYVSNNPFGHLLHRNNNDSTFSEVAEDSGVAVFDMGWSAIWLDYDLDGYQDLHVCCSPFWLENGQEKFFRNNGDGTFDNYISEAGFYGDLGWSHGSAMGDINNDGHPDIAVNKDSPDVSRIWQASQTENSYVKVNLEGVVSNREGVGSRVELYSDGNFQMRYTICGEGYLSQNTMSEFFGLGESDSVDSLVVTWLSGHQDFFYDLEVDSTYYIIEGSSMSTFIALDDHIDICAGDTATLNPGNWYSVEWHGEMLVDSVFADSILVSESGNYIFTVQNQFGLSYTDSVVVNVIDSLEYIENVQHVSCHGLNDGSLDIISPDAVNVDVFAAGELVASDSLATGEYDYWITDIYGCLHYDEVFISEPSILENEILSTDPTCYGSDNGSVVISSSGGTPPYSYDWGGFDPESLPAGQYAVDISDSLGCQLQESFELTQPDSLSLVLDVIDAIEGVSPGSVSIDVDGGIAPYFIFIDTTAYGEVLYIPLEANDYIIAVIDGNGCQLDSSFVINSVLGLDELGTEGGMVYPNPSSDKIYLTNDHKDFSIIRIYDSRGILVYQNSNLIENADIEIDVSNFEKGFYLLIAASKEKKLNVEKIIIE